MGSRPRPSLIAAAEEWREFIEDSALPGLFLVYGEEFGEVCDPDWNEAERLADVGELHAIGLRHNGFLVGFCLCRILAELPFKNRRIALASEIYVDTLYRGDGTKILLDKAKEVMRAAGCRRFALHHSMLNPAILAPLGSGVSMRVWSVAL